MTKCTQPATDIQSYINGYLFSVRCKVDSFIIPGGYVPEYSKPYKAGRIAGHNEVKLTQLITGNKS